MSTTYYSTVTSPLGPILMLSDGTGLTGLRISDPNPEPGWVEASEALPFAQAREELAAYFAGERTSFTIPLAPVGTAFQKQVWAELEKIPYGLTISYGELATRIGNPAASRAVGLANGRNPLWLVVPCHRVIGSSGKMVGYAGGVHRKIALLDFEAAVLASGPQGFPTTAT
jgi:methylated-DNA-[protein]-cysteine S-methyltransferase